MYVKLLLMFACVALHRLLQYRTWRESRTLASIIPVSCNITHPSHFSLIVDLCRCWLFLSSWAGYYLWIRWDIGHAWDTWKERLEACVTLPVHLLNWPPQFSFCVLRFDLWRTWPHSRSKNIRQSPRLKDWIHWNLDFGMHHLLVNHIFSWFDFTHNQFCPFLVRYLNIKLETSWSHSDYCNINAQIRRYRYNWHWQCIFIHIHVICAGSETSTAMITGS